MIEVNSILKRAVDKGGFSRIKYIEKDIPTSMSNIVVMPFFGDFKSMFFLSSLFLKRYRQEMKGSKYFILCSWPGFEGFFPYVNEYWTIDKSLAQTLFKESDGFGNNSKSMENLLRNFNHFFEDVVDFSVVNSYYRNGLTQEYFDKFKHIKVFLPAVPSPLVMGTGFARELEKRVGPKVFIYPSLYHYGWNNGKEVKGKTEYDFWVYLIEKLVEEGFVPVIYQNILSHDVSSVVSNKCICISDDNMLNITAVMRATDCVLDIFSGIYRFGLVARCPVINCDERARYFETNEFEIEDLCGKNVPIEHVFGFSTILDSKDKSLWKNNILDIIISKVTKVIEKYKDRSSAVEVDEIVPYSGVRKRKIRKFGARFLKIERE